MYQLKKKVKELTNENLKMQHIMKNRKYCIPPKINEPEDEEQQQNKSGIINFSENYFSLENSDG